MPRRIARALLSALVACDADPSPTPAAPTASPPPPPLSAPEPPPLRRLQGLERMYFEHVAGPAGAGRPGDAAPPPGFPDTLPAGAARGFALGDPTSGLTLLEQLDAGPDRGRDPRTWWALYDGDTRSDVWSFQPSTASGGDGKVLTDYHFDSAERRDDQLFVRITGSGHLNGARSWSVGEELTFEVTPAGLALLRVRNAWTTSSDLGLRVEREVGDTFVSTEVVVSDDVLAVWARAGRGLPGRGARPVGRPGARVHLRHRAVEEPQHAVDRAKQGLPLVRRASAMTHS